MFPPSLKAKYVSLENINELLQEFEDYSHVDETFKEYIERTQDYYQFKGKKE